ncbi:MAG: LytTR family DNA-binding domain-containing protein [Prevotella sp.]
MNKKLKEPKNIRIMRESLYAGVFVILLLWLTMPFNVETIHDDRPLFFFAQGFITVIVSILTGAFSAYVLHIPMDPTLPLKTVHRNTVLMYLVNIPVLSFVLTVFGGFFFCENPIEPWWYGGQFHFTYFFEYIYYVSTTCIFLYIGTYVRNRNWHLNYQLEEVRAINALLEKRQEKIAKSEETHEEQKEEKVCHLVGNSNNAVFEVLPSTIIYVESMANYADICYMDGDNPTHKTLRITLKQIREKLDGIDSLVQCHRAFIVNLNFVVSLSNRNTGYQLQLFGTDKCIPVSRTNTAAVKEKLSQ